MRQTYRSVSKVTILTTLLLLCSNSFFTSSVWAIHTPFLLASNRPAAGTTGLHISNPQFYNDSIVFSTYSPSTNKAYTSSIKPDGNGGYSFGANQLTADYASDTINAYTEGSYSAADMDGDGIEELAFLLDETQDDYFGVFRLALEYASGAIHVSPYADSEFCTGGSTAALSSFGGIFSAIADVDHDGTADAMGGAECSIYIMNNRGALSRHISASSVKNHHETHFTTSPVLADFSGDKLTDIAIAGRYKVTSGSNEEYYVATLQYNGSKIWEYSLGTEEPGQPLAVDVDENGVDELIICTSQKLRVLNNDGTIKWQKDSPCYSAIASNMDGDPELEIVYTTSSTNIADSTINVLNGDNGSAVDGYPLVIADSTIRNTPISIKLSASHTSNDLLVPTDKGLKAYRGSDRVLLWTLNAEESCEFAGVWPLGEEIALVYRGGHFTNDEVLELYALRDAGEPLSADIQNDVYPMPGVSPQNSYNMRTAPLAQADGGYRLVASDGGVFPLGNARGYGSTGNIRLHQPMVGMSTTPSGEGYWLVAADGGIFPFGDAAGKGSTGNIRLHQPMVGMASTPSGQGYWLVAADGGIFPFGDAPGKGSTGNVKLWAPIVGMERTASGNGYWLVARDGGIFPFGDAVGFGSTGNIKLHAPIVGMSRTASGNGYWLVAADGGVFPFGDAVGYGSAGNLVLAKPMVGMKVTPSGNGYWLTAADGGIFTYGDARYYGSTGHIRLNQPIVGIGK